MADIDEPRTISRLSRDDRTREILAASRKLLARKGYEAFVTSEVAEMCQISEGTIYRYFPTKRDLLIRVAEDWFAEIIGNEPRTPKSQGTEARLRHFIAHCLAVMRNEPALTRFILIELRSDPAYRAMRVFELNRRFTSKVVEVLRDAVASGEIAGDVPLSLLRDMIFGGLEHATWAALRGESAFPGDDVAAGIARVVFRGTAVHPATARYDELDSAIARLDGIAARLAAQVKE